MIRKLLSDPSKKSELLNEDEMWNYKVHPPFFTSLTLWWRSKYMLALCNAGKRLPDPGHREVKQYLTLSVLCQQAVARESRQSGGSQLICLHTRLSKHSESELSDTSMT